MIPSTVRSPFSSATELKAALDRSETIQCRLVAGEELGLHLRIREAVFVREQRIFQETDRDAHDEDPATLHVLGCWGPLAGGTVRLYPFEEHGLWKGDRLAVLPEFRNHGLGGPLVRFAVREAARRGGSRMIAYIQPANVAFFERLGWERVGDVVDYVGQPHQQMEIDLRPFS